MDNFRIDITAEGDKTLDAAIDLGFCQHRNGAAIGYRVDPKRGLIFYWAESDRMTRLPFKLDAAGAADFARRWLREQDYGREPDHDGDNGRGWRVYNEDWGHIESEFQAFLAVKPAWAMYGK